MLGASLMALPMGEGAPLVDHLQAVHANIPHAGLGIARDHLWKSNEAPSVLRPALQNG